MFLKPWFVCMNVLSRNGKLQLKFNIVKDSLCHPLTGGGQFLRSSLWLYSFCLIRDTVLLVNWNITSSNFDKVWTITVDCPLFYGTFPWETSSSWVLEIADLCFLRFPLKTSESAHFWNPFPGCLLYIMLPTTLETTSHIWVKNRQGRHCVGSLQRVH